MLLRATRSSVLQSLRNAVALVLMSGGSVLLYFGAHDYWASQHAQQEMAATWTTPAGHPQVVSKPRLDTPIPEGQAFSQMEVPRLHKSLYVVEGDAASALAKGPGHVRGSAMPGEKGNCVIAGHRDLHFRFLKDVQNGDPIYLATDRGRFCYRVTGTKIINTDEREVLQPTADPELHLITCYPFYFIGHAPKRFVVTAQLETSGGDDQQPTRVVKVASSSTAVRAKSMAQKANFKTIHLEASRRSEEERIVRYRKSLEATRALNLAAAQAGG